MHKTKDFMAGAKDSGNGRPPLVDDKTLRDLEFHEIAEAVRSRVTYGKAAGLVGKMRPMEDAGERERTAALVRELMELMEAGEGETLPDLAGLEDPTPLIERLAKGGVLTGEELLAVESLIPAFLHLHRLTRGAPRDFPRLEEMVRGACGDDVAAAELERASLEIASILDEEGDLKEGATAELKQLRSRMRAFRSEIGEKVRRLMESLARFLQDDYYTLRDGRYVLPVRSEERTHVKGIIHGYSQSGATVYIEPEPIIEDCNRLKILEGEIQAEEEKILGYLSSLLSAHLQSLKDIEELLCSCDYLGAIARFGRSIGGTLAGFTDEPALRLDRARHPNLLLRGVDVVPNDIDIRTGQGWIISGPNAGGKTILLKTAGLCLVMAYSAIPIPAGDRSRVGGFEAVRSVIGDDQSVARDLSTFSAQVHRLTEALACASPRSFIMLDELATGTEPAEGAALAREILVELVEEKGAAVMAATHFASLKQLSISHDSFTAAGMGFDFDRLAPTFRLALGMPGVSGGLVVAGKYGLPLHIIERARSNIEQEGDRLTLEIEEIEKMKKQLENELGTIESKKKEIKGKEKEVEDIKRKLLDKKRKELTAQEAYLTSELKLLHGEIKEAHKLLRRRPASRAAVESSSRTAERISRMLAPEGKLTRMTKERDDLMEVDPGSLVRGQRVHVRKLGIAGEFEGMQGKKAKVRSGGKSILVPASEIFIARERNTMDREKEPDEGPAGENGTGEMDDHQNPYNTLDVRGRALDEALIELDDFIENLAEMGLRACYVIHGHGTGVLKNGIRRHLRHLKRVESFRPGKKGEGGDGCTVVSIREM